MIIYPLGLYLETRIYSKDYDKLSQDQFAEDGCDLRRKRFGEDNNEEN